jgi:opacity protein-like surface antigen
VNKLSFLASLVVLCLPLAALAQEEAPKVEISGGYSFVNGGGDTSHGFNLSFTGNATKYIGVVGEFNRYTESETINIPNLSAFPIEGFPTLPTLPDLGPINAKANLSLSTFLFGPRLTLIRGKKAEPFVHGLLGAARASVDFSGPGITGGGDDSAFAFALGGGVDVKVHRNLAIRVGQLDYLGIRGGNIRSNSFRYSAGVVIRLGNR